MSEKKCEYCGSTKQVHSSTQFGVDICAKHFRQMKNHGRIVERSIYDKNEFVIYDDYAEMILYDKYCDERGRCLVDIEDIDRIKLYKWCLRKDLYSYTGSRNKQRIALHRYILKCNDEDIEVDHISRNRLDCRKQNLREVNHKENGQNKSLLSTNTSGFVGVNFNKRKQKWFAKIEYNTQIISLGYHSDIKDAVVKRVEAEKLYFGDKRNPHNELKLKELYNV